MSNLTEKGEYQWQVRVLQNITNIPAAKIPVYNARVSYPINDNSSKEIRNNILNDFFGYTENDIKALDEQKSGYFYINDSRHKDRWATGDEVKAWIFNPDGTIQIEMPPQKVIDSLIAFRDQRASLETYKVGMFITDTETRKNFTDDLEIIFSSTGVKRIDALTNFDGNYRRFTIVTR